MRAIQALLLAITVLFFSCISASAQCVALTFDDGPHPSLTPKLLNILEHENVKATFYMVGRMVKESPAVARAVAGAGHEIGNHSYTHPNLQRLSARDVLSQIERADEAILAATGSLPKTLRAPYGEVPRVKDIHGRRYVGWDVDTNDWKYRNSAHVTHVAASSGSREIILMHDIHPTTVAAVPAIIQKLKARGFRFVTVSQYLSGECSTVAHTS